MTKSQILLMLEIMHNRRCRSIDSISDDVKYKGMFEMFMQVICIEDKETCEAVIEYFITNNEVSGNERTNFAETVTSFNYFIENYEKAINDGYIIDNVNAQVMLHVFRLFLNSKMMNVVFYEKFGTRAEYWNARLEISTDDYQYAVLEGNAVCSSIMPNITKFIVTFDDGSKLGFGMRHGKVFLHYVKE